MTAPYDPYADYTASCDFASAVLRERAVRSGTTPPINDTERRWADEGPTDRLETIGVPS